MPSFDTVDAYLDAQPETAREILRRVRKVVRKAASDLDESVTYKIPTYKLHGQPVVFFAAWKAHWSLYPASAAVFAAVPELLRFKHAKDTVRFGYGDPVREKLVTAMVRVRVTETRDKTAAGALAKPPARTKKKAQEKIQSAKKPTNAKAGAHTASKKRPAATRRARVATPRSGPRT